jgi:TolA-binding protein
MKLSTVAFLSTMIFATGIVHAEEMGKGGVPVSAVKTEKPKRSFESWLKDLKKRVSRTRARPNQLVAVASVRGDEKDVAPKLYWKGKHAEGPTSAAELEEFETAIDAALANDPSAKTKLQNFVSAYPKSALTPDANSALERMAAVEAQP